MFVVEYRLVNTSVKFEFPTKVEAEAFVKGVTSAVNWPQRTHYGGGTVVEVVAPVKPVDVPVKPVVKEAEVKE